MKGKTMSILGKWFRQQPQTKTEMVRKAAKRLGLKVIKYKPEDYKGIPRLLHEDDEQEEE